MYEKNGVEYSTRTECIDWRYSAAILGLVKFYEYAQIKGFDLKFDYDEDYIYYNIEDITEELFLGFAENSFKKDMHHVFVENAIRDKNEFTEDEIKIINERLLGNTTLKKYFSKNKFNGENKSEILDLINANRQEIIRETFRNKTNLYRNYNNTNSLFSEKKENCRVLGYCIDMPKKGKSVGYNFNTSTFVAEDDVVFDFIPFGFVMGSDAVFINNNSSIKNLETTNNVLAMELDKKEKENDNNRALSAKNVLFNMIVESSDYIDYDVEVITKKRENDYFETLYIRKESIEVFQCIKKKIQDYSYFARKYKVNENYYIDIQDKVIDAVLNMRNVTDIIQILLKDDNASDSLKYSFLIDKLIKVNVMITGGVDMYEEKEKCINSAKYCAFHITKNSLMSGNNSNKLKSYRTKLTSALVFKDYKRYCDILMQMANYLNMELDFAYNLFVDFEENEDIAYAFVNGLAAGKDEKNKETEGKNEEE